MFAVIVKYCARVKSIPKNIIIIQIIPTLTMLSHCQAKSITQQPRSSESKEGGKPSDTQPALVQHIFDLRVEERAREQAAMTQDTVLC